MKIESVRAHRISIPKSTPAIAQVVTVPGPMKAAAMKIPRRFDLRDGVFKKLD